MNIATKITPDRADMIAAEETLDGCYLCEGCDRPRTGPLAYCPDCEEVTESYMLAPEPYWERDIAPISTVYRFAKEQSLSLPARIDALASKRASL